MAPLWGAIGVMPQQRSVACLHAAALLERPLPWLAQLLTYTRNEELYVLVVPTAAYGRYMHLRHARDPVSMSFHPTRVVSTLQLER
jgi:hypothetical protein